MRPSRNVAPRERAARFQAAIAFLRKWLPDDAKQTYREMIKSNPEAWWLDPHFEGGIIAEHALRGNGIDERALGIDDLNAVWPHLLWAAVQDSDAEA